MEKPYLHPNNKVYTLKPKFISDIQAYFRKLRLKRYKRMKIKDAKTKHLRNYHLSFKIHVRDENNSQVSDIAYEMVVPARAAYFAKLQIEKEIKNKIYIEILNWEEITEEEHQAYLKSQEEYQHKQIVQSLR